MGLMDMIPAQLGEMRRSRRLSAGKPRRHRCLRLQRAYRARTFNNPRSTAGAMLLRLLATLDAVSALTLVTASGASPAERLAAAIDI
jgi:hypothetical protein